MAYNYEYPYTDVHRHNDDWLINRVKELSLEWIETRKEWNNTREEFASLKAFIQNYFAQLDVQDEVNVKLDIMARDGSLSALISPLFSEYKKEIDRAMSEQNENISILRARMDALGYVTPEMFGAVGDGSTDDTIALNTMFSFNSKTIVFPKNKTYLVSDSVTINSNDTTVLFNGSRLKASDSMANSSTPAYEGVLTVNADNVKLYDLIVNGSKTYIERTDTEGLETTEQYYNERSKGHHGILIYESSNVLLYNCKAELSILGICCYLSNSVVIQNCKAINTLADGIATYTGNHNVHILNCYCENNGDDAFPVYSSRTNTGATQTENVLIEHCKSVNCMARAMLNHGGKNITYKDIIVENARQLFAVLGQGYGSYDIFETNYTTIENVNGSVELYSGFDTMALGQCEYFGNVELKNIIVTPTEIPTEETRNCYLLINNGNINMDNCNIEYFPLVSGGSSQKIRITNSGFTNGKTHSKFTNAELILNNVEFSNNGSYIFTISAATLAEVRNVKGDTSKLIGGIMASNAKIITDDISLFNTGTLSDKNVYFTTPMMLTELLSNNGKYQNGAIIFVNGLPYYWNGTEWINAISTN